MNSSVFNRTVRILLKKRPIIPKIPKQQKMTFNRINTIMKKLFLLGAMLAAGVSANAQNIHNAFNDKSFFVNPTLAVKFNL